MTIETTPPTYSSANDPLVWVVVDAYSVDIAKLNFKYIAEVRINSVLCFTSKVYPNPINNRGIFELDSIIRNYLVSTFAAEQGAGQFSQSVEVKFGYEYLVGSTLTTAMPSTSTVVVFNHYGGRTSNFTDLATYVNKPATNRPTTIYITDGATTYYLPYFATTTSAFNVVINGTTTTITPTATNTMHRINIAAGLSADYTVVLGGTTYKVKVVCDGLYTNYTLHFLNKWGGFDSMLFNKVSRKKYTAEKKSFQQMPYRVSSTGVVSIKTGNVMHTQKSVFGMQFSEQLKVSTDWLSDAEYQWLAQLVTSPIVYLEDNGTLYPITIGDTNYEFKTNIVDSLTNLSLDIEFGTKYNTQYL